MSNPPDSIDPNDPISDLKLELARFTEEHLMTAARAKTWGAIQVIPSREVDRLKDLAAEMVRVCFAHAIDPRDFPLLKSSLEVLNPDPSNVSNDGQSDGQIEAQIDPESQNR
jgi:hypothetical protein